MEEFGNAFDPEFSTMCSNVPRTFLNEEGCFLSDAPSACYTNPQRDEGPEAFFPINHATLRTIYEVTGDGDPGTLIGDFPGNSLGELASDFVVIRFAFWFDTGIL